MATTYDATRDTITGDKLFLFVNSGGSMLPIAFGTTCGVDLSADTIEASSKMSGDWKDYLVGQLGYTVSSESLVSFKTGHMSYKTLLALMASRTPIAFAMSKAVKTDGDFTEGEDFVKGNAIITALTIKSDNGAIITSSVSLQGTGPLLDGANALVVSPTSLAFTAAADATGKTITSTSTGNVTYAAAPSDIEWLTVTKSAKVVTVKVSANTNSESRTANVTIIADGITATVPVTQAGA